MEVLGPINHPPFVYPLRRLLSSLPTTPLPLPPRAILAIRTLQCHAVIAMIPISALSPAKRQFSNNRPATLDPSVLRFSRFFQAADDEAVIRLRQIVDVHYRSAEIEGLLSELGEVDVSSDEDSDAMEWSLSEGQPPRTKVINCFDNGVDC